MKNDETTKKPFKQTVYGLDGCAISLTRFASAAQAANAHVDILKNLTGATTEQLREIFQSSERPLTDIQPEEVRQWLCGHNA